jgi:hypothetical protein
VRPDERTGHGAGTQHLDDTVLEYKHASVANVGRLVALVLRHLPELSQERAERFTTLAALMATAVWTHNQVPPAVVAAYESDESLAWSINDGIGHGRVNL